MSEDNGDSAGYGRPPKKGQYKKGQSGNPTGRPKGSKNVATVLAKALRERVTIVENGRRRTVTKLEAAVKQLVNRAASGDERFMRQLLNLVGFVEGREEAQAPSGDTLTAGDREVLAAIRARMSQVPAEGERISDGG